MMKSSILFFFYFESLIKSSRNLPNLYFYQNVPYIISWIQSNWFPGTKPGEEVLDELEIGTYRVLYTTMYFINHNCRISKD